MNSGLPKKIIFTSLLSLSFINPLQSADFSKIDENGNKKDNKYSWSKVLNDKVSSNFPNQFFSRNLKQIPEVNKISDFLVADISKKKEELVIQSDKQFEQNNIINAKGNASLSYRGKLLKADNIIFDKSSKKISAEGNITLVFGEQIFKMSKFEYNIKDETGVLLDVKGFINSDKLLTDISKNFYNSDIQKLDYLLNLQKKEVLYTPNKINNWIFFTEKISIVGKKWKSNQAIFSNDILQSKQVKIIINLLELYSLNEDN